MMPTSYPPLIARNAIAVCRASYHVYARFRRVFVRAPYPTAVQQSDEHVSRVITTAEDHFRKGKINLEDTKRDQA